MRKTIVAAGATALTLALATFSGTALAGGGHGGGQSGSSPGNSGNAQGHQQQSSSSQQTSTVQTGGDNSQGTKPSSTTSHDTYATAGSGHTKRYGNGKTAGQIAEQNGASSDTVLHGPGNSQPHKAALCPGGHERDVHALKAGSGGCTQTPHVKTQTTPTHSTPAPMIYICHATGSASNPYVLIHVSSNSEDAHAAHQGGRDIILGASAGSGCPQPTPAVAAATTAVATTTVPVTSTVAATSTVQSTSTVQATTTVTSTQTSTSAVLGAATSTTSPAAVLAAPPTTTTTPTGGVLGAQATLKPRPRPSSGILGTIGSTTLPFTGLPLWPVVLGALALIAAGAAVRRTQRGTL